MARNDVSSSRIPPYLVAITATLLSARLVFALLPAEAGGGQMIDSGVSWMERPDRQEVRTISGADSQSEPAREELSPPVKAELDAMLAEARSRNKILLLEFSSPGSDACRTMDSTSLKNREVETLLASDFYPVRINDCHKIAGKNPALVSELQKKFRVFAFPTLLVVSEKGNMENLLIGNCSSLTTYRFLSRSVHKRAGS
ncbi:MAG: thioredoxin family protein [Candidatus Obscuribacterales bacterium]